MDNAVGPQVIEEILALKPEDAARYVHKRIGNRSLTPLMSTLNREALSGDPARRQRAEAALLRLGFDPRS